MGFPLQNNYSLLRKLGYGSRGFEFESGVADDDTEYMRIPKGAKPSFGEPRSRFHKNRLSEDPYEIRLVEEALQSFNLFAFVIHDPKEHPAFDAHLSNVFELLDHSTGKRLLFFALVDQPGRSEFGESCWRFYRETTHMPRSGYLFENAVETADGDLTAFALANVLKIPESELPVIVVTNNLQAKNFRWFKTSREHLDRQLNALGFLASRNPEIKRHWPLFEELIEESVQQYDPLRSSESQSLVSNMAKALSDLLAFVTVNKAGNHEEREIATGQARNSLINLQKQLSRMKADSASADEARREEFDELNIQMAGFLALLDVAPRRNFSPIPHIRYNYLEPESVKLLKTARAVSNVLMDPFNDVRFIVGNPQNIDFTPLTICLCKLFETETDLSVVHWIRKYLGVQLPEYFNKYQPGVNAVHTPSDIIPEARPVDFNRQRRNNWAAPGMNESRICFDSLSGKARTEKSALPFEDDKIQNLLEIWRNIGYIRNESAHPGIIDRIRFNGLVLLLEEMNENQLFELFSVLKAGYRGQRNHE